MYILRIEHAVSDFDAWKTVFDSDPLGRKQGGVRRYRILRQVDDPNHVLIDLEFDGADEAESFAAALREIWGRVDVMRDPKARIAEVVESKDL
jgi:prolyl oligopeptidase PreP (S9A serine peptidase family)